MKRRAFITSAAAGIASFGIISRRASAAEFVYKFANNQPETHPTNTAAKKAADRIRQESGGRLDIQIFPNNQLGGDTDMLSQVRSGALEFYMLSPTRLANIIPDAGISGLGFVFPDYDAVWKAMDGELGAFIRAQMPKAQLVSMPKIWDNGFRHITTSSRPINSAADLKNLKIRVPTTQMWISLFKALGTAPTGIDFAELYSALQTKVVDGQENPLSIIQFGKLYEVQKYCSFTSHMWDGFWFVASKKQWDRLPGDLQALVSRHMDLAADEQRAEIRGLNESLQGDLQKRGMTFNSADTASLMKTVADAGYYKEWKGKFGADAWTLLQKYTGAVG
ncbi:ABC transporter substrate-binding protein [Paramagnetospirillum kuznetsovii]|uniref:ABC transporter substrate-binding protein n=1 Tax=Paramagnetospirillum kuznetsovii TaxID=2053833 RepID=A0A364NW86_9PROT|nr:TRAP transporter substrate-binding protein [Paramagnetospirillum kuznetsovii]RAU21313.1 ABC transporter substrate-binding protein [Paramagnetospirillum kuznetsovii]